MTRPNPSASSPNPAASGAAPVSLVTATALAVANMIGIGVFTSLGFQVRDLPSGFTMLMLWVMGGVFALCGALSYAELATAFPRSGGEYNFLTRIYHRSIGFLAGWMSATVGFAAPTALAAMAFGSYFAGAIPDAPPLILALVVVWGIALIHLLGVRRAAEFQNVSTLIKVVLILAFILAAIAVGVPQPIAFAPVRHDLDYLISPAFAVSLAFVMYAYTGWSAATYVAGEVQDPKRTLPISIIVAVITVTLLYVALNAVFLYTTPLDQIAGQIDVAVISGQHIFGDIGGRVVGLVICVGLVSSISAMMWVGPRVTMVMGEDHPLLAPFARRNGNGVPVTAILFQLGMVTLLLLTQSFESVLEFIQFSLTVSSFLTVLGVMVLRYRAPDLPRPYRVWGYPVTPLLFLAISLFTMVHLVLARPVQSLAGLGMMLTGLIVYGLSRRFARA